MTYEVVNTIDISVIDETINSLDITLKLEHANIKDKQVILNDKKYRILRYDKDLLTKEVYNTTGIVRSMIYKDNKLVCYAPPKSIDYDMFKNQVPLSNISSIEEYVEGTMVNLFWNGDSWEIATRSSVGGNVSFFSEDNVIDNPTFRRMFIDAIASEESDSLSNDVEFFQSFDTIPKTFSLSFVLQHPNNRIVVPFKKPSIYLVKVYNIVGDGLVKELHKDCVSSILPKWVKYPKQLTTPLCEIENALLSGSCQYDNVGVIIYGMDSVSGNIVRTKIRNITYETVRRLRGNQPKLKYHYFILRQEGKITEYLKYYPEHKEKFYSYRQQIHTFTTELYASYVSCYIMKSKELKNYSNKYRTHMFKLHEIYKASIATIKKSITKNIVIGYVNSLHPSLLMHSINMEE